MISTVLFSELNAQHQLTDQVFINFLKSQNASLVNGNDELVISVANAFGSPTFDLSNQGLSNVDGVQYFINLQNLDLSNNNITSLPDLNNLTQLKTLNISNNFISELQTFSPITFPVLQSLDVGNNLLYYDDFISFPAVITQNAETQRKVEVITPDTLYIGDTLIIDLSIDTHPSNFNVLIERSTFFELEDSYTTELKWAITDTSQSGTYFIDLINTAIVSHRYKTIDFTITVLAERPVTPQPNPIPVLYQSELIPDGTIEERSVYLSGSGEAVIFNKSGEVYNRFPLPFEWDGRNSDGIIIPGYYIIKLDDDRVVKITVIY